MKLTVSLLFLLFLNGLIAQQVSDTTYTPPLIEPAYPPNKGPVIFIDEGHHNFHTRDGRYTPFTTLAERDGYRVHSYTGSFDKRRLRKGEILVIANALNVMNTGGNWHVPTPSAFTESEIEVIERWVSSGGSLFLIADHMPMAGAAADLAKVFGYTFTNGFVFDTVSRGSAVFSVNDNSLINSMIIEGRNKEEEVYEIVTFTGQAFKIPEHAQPVLKFDSKYINIMPDTAWIFRAGSPSQGADGWYQGAYSKHGKGKVAVFGEAAMFTAQLAGQQAIKVGMNNDQAQDNYKLLLNIIHWLDGIIE